MYQIDWKKSNQTLATELNLSIQKIASMRKNQAPHTVISWENVDWSKPSSSLAKVYGVSMGMISRMRSKYAPDTKSWSWHGSVGGIDWGRINWRLSNKRIKEITGSNNVSKMRQRFAPETLRRKIKKRFCAIGGKSCTDNDHCNHNGVCPRK